MKQRFLLPLLFLVLILADCSSPPRADFYRPSLPSLPASWGELLGEPEWRLEWIDEEGREKVWEGGARTGFPELSLAQEWSSPILAWPFWPEKGLFPGDMKPAGAIFPWDVSGGRVDLSWLGGVDAFFWRELAAGGTPQVSGTPRVPWYFDWPRFRELLEDPGTKEAVRLDPWTADWKLIAKNTLESGFSRSRLSPHSPAELTVPGLGGLWIGSSPFAPPLDFPPAGPLALPVGEGAETWVSSLGVLRCSKKAWFFSGL
jgi:hypothetical protein